MDERYKPMLALKDITEESLKELNNKKVIIIGQGGLGSWSAEFLLRAGILNLTLVDGDKVELKNILRQNYDEPNIGKYKVQAMKNKLEGINSKAKITALDEFLTEKNTEMLRNHDLIIDGCDNLNTRYIINKFCIENEIPWIYGTALAYQGYAKIITKETSCLECIYPRKKVSEENITSRQGILISTNVTVATLQTKLALEVLLNKKIHDELIFIDIENHNINTLKVKKRKGCICSD